MATRRHSAIASFIILLLIILETAEELQNESRTENSTMATSTGPSANSTVNSTDANGNRAAFKQSNADRLLQELLHRCPYLNTYQKPVQSQLDVIEVSMLLTLDRFLGIDDAEETFGIAGTFTICWTYPACASWLNAAEFNDTYWLYLPLQNSSSGVKRWFPTIKLRNAAQDSGIIRHMTTDLGYLYINRDGQGCIEPYGQADMTCPLAQRLVKFPFDVHTCNITFDRQANDPTITFLNLGFDNGIQASVGYDNDTASTNDLCRNKTLRLQAMVPDYFVEDASVWELIDIGYDGSDSRLSYQFAFRRKPKAAIFSTIMPSVLLMFLQLFVYAIPPHHPERPIYSITVVLSFYILQTVLVSNIPESSVTLDIVNYLACQLCLGVFVTLYTCISTHFGNMYKHKPIMLFRRKPYQNNPGEPVDPIQEAIDHENVPKSGGIDAVRFADVIAATVTILVMAIYNGYLFLEMRTSDPDPILPWGDCART